MTNLKCFILLFTPRSGSSLIAGDLSANNCGMGIELFHRIDGYFHQEDLSLLDRQFPYSEIDRVMALYQKGGIFGFKMTYIQYVAFINYFRGRGIADEAEENGHSTLLKSIFPSLRLILVRRNDTLAQAISLVKAKSTGQWDSFVQSKDTELEPGAQWLIEAIISHLAELQREQLFLERAVSSLELPTKIVDYEAYIEARHRNLRDLLGFVHSENPNCRVASQWTKDVLIDERFSKQRTDQNEHWERIITNFMMSRAYLKIMS